MKLWEWIIAAVVLFLIWGKLSKKVVPKSCIAACRPVFPLLANCSAGDNFAGGKTTVAGVCEPTPVAVANPIRKVFRPLTCDAQCGGSVHPITSPHIFFPVNPPLASPAQVACSNPPIPVLRRVPTQPPIYSDTAPVWCGNGPGWCVSKLDQLANRPRGMGAGCGSF
jgi:hypothetical protein